MTRHAQIVGTHTVYGTEQETHARVEIYEVVAPGIRRRVDHLDVSLLGAGEDDEVTRASVEFVLQQAGLLGADDRVLSEHEARTAVMHGVNP